MTADRMVWTLFAGVLGVLILATLGGLWLKRRYGETAAVTNFNSRTHAWWVMVAIMALAILTGRGGTILLFAVASGIALYEFLVLTAARPADRFALTVAFAVLLPAQYALIWIEWYGLFAVFIPVYGFLLLPILSVVQADTRDFMARVAELQWGLMLAVFCLSHVPALMLIPIPGYEGRNILMVAFLIIVVQFSDVTQYLWGKLLGRHKIAPALSPSKTVEGLAGGMVTSSALGMGLWWITPFTPLEALAIALGITAMGFFGGLVMSAIKRDRGVKDWGNFISGHGGMLDRLDSVLFSAPVFFHIVRYGWSA